MTSPRRVLALALMASLLAGCDAVTVPTQGPSSADEASAAAALAPSPSLAPSASPVATTTVVGDRYADGLPRTLDGTPVLRGNDAVAHATAATDDTPFLVAGWVTYRPGTRYCALQLASDTSWLHDCVQPQFANVAGTLAPKLSAAITFRFVLEGLVTGPVVATVRVHDPRASECGSAAAACDRLMVAQDIVWAGDGGTAPSPLSAETVARTVESIQPVSQVTPLGPDMADTGCGSDLAAGTILVVSEPEREPPSRPFVTRVVIEPSVAAREHALEAAAGPTGALRAAALTCTAFSRTPTGSWSEEYRWLAVDNVALLVRTDHGPSAEDRAFLERLAAGLAAAAASPG